MSQPPLMVFFIAILDSKLSFASFPPATLLVVLVARVDFLSADFALTPL